MNKMWSELDYYLMSKKAEVTVEDARLLYYFCDQVERFGYQAPRIRVLLDCYMNFNNSAWQHVRKLEAKGAFDHATD